VNLEVGGGEFVPRAAPLGDVGKPSRQPSLASEPATLDLGQGLAQEGTRVGQDRKRRRVVAPELGVVDVDMDQFGLGEIP